MKNVSQRETVLLGQRNIQPIVSGGGLQFEIKRTTEALSQRQSPSLVDSSAERGMNDELHAAAFIEETFSDHGGLRGHGAQNGAPSHNIFDRLLGPSIVKSTFALEPFHRRGNLRRLLWRVSRHGSRRERADSFAQLSKVCGELGRAPRRLAAPERNIGRSALRVFDQDTAGLHAPDPPGGVAEQDDIAREAFHCKVFVDGANQSAFRLSKNSVERIVRDCATAGDGGQPAASASADTPIHAVSVQVGGVTPPATGDALGKHFDDSVESGARQVFIGISAANDLKEVILAPVLSGAHGYNLLGQYVHRRIGNLDMIQLTLANRSDECCAFEQFVASRGEDAALGNGAAPVASPSDALQRNTYGPWRANLADEVNRANVDT